MMWNAWLQRRRWERTLDAELRFHLEQLIEDNLAAGLSPDEARLRARRDLGSIELAKDECRDQRPFSWLSDAAADARFAFRTFARAPGFTAIAVLTLALGIGANTAMFTLFHRVLVQMLPVTQPEQLVELGCVNANEPDKVGCRASYPAFQMYRDNNQMLSGLFAFAPTADLNVIHEGGAELSKGLLATGEMYSVLGVTPALGRLFNTSDDAPSAPPVAVLSHAYWQRRFGGDPRVIGQTVRINTQVATVVGVTPAAFRGVTLGEPAEITLAMGSGANLFHGAGSLENGANQWLRMIGRRKPGVSVQQVEATLIPVFQRTIDHLISSIPAGMESRARAYFNRVQFQVQPAAAGGASSFRRDLDRPLRTLMAAMGVVLLMACVNLASLLLSRVAGRRREFGIRLAIGAGPGRLLRQLLTETMLLSVAGAALGVAIAQVSGPVLLKMASGEIGLQSVDLTPDLPVLSFTSAVALLAGILLSIGPIFHIRNADPQNPMRDGNQNRTASKMARSLIPAQAALATLVLIGAGLLMRTFENLARVDLGFRSENRITFTVSPGLVGYDGTRAKSFLQELTRRLEAAPGVLSATLSNEVMGGLGSMTMVEVPGFESATPMARVVGRGHVGSRFVETNGLKLLRGRDFVASDNESSRRVAVINESFARHFFRSTDVINRLFSFSGENETPFMIVGLVADARDRGPKSPTQPVVYTPFSQQRFGRAVVTLRVLNCNPAMIGSVRSVVNAVDPGVPIQGLRTIGSTIDEALRRERLLAVLGMLFGCLVLLLVSIGIYGLIAGAVAQRTSEIGIRIALGANKQRILWMFLGDGLALVALGLGVGLAAGALLTRFLGSQLFDVTPNDPATFMMAVGVMLTATIAASLEPALRASQTEPISALRQD